MYRDRTVLYIVSSRVQGNLAKKCAAINITQYYAYYYECIPMGGSDAFEMHHSRRISHPHWNTSFLHLISSSLSLSSFLAIKQEERAQCIIRHTERATYRREDDGEREDEKGFLLVLLGKTREKDFFKQCACTGPGPVLAGKTVLNSTA